ncbi:MAG: protein kinase [Planctomycetota bacterium]|nr:protein kinase [Planctomycetota bacterium]
MSQLDDKDRWIAGFLVKNGVVEQSYLLNLISSKPPTLDLLSFLKGQGVIDGRQLASVRQQFDSAKTAAISLRKSTRTVALKPSSRLMSVSQSMNVPVSGASRDAAAKLLEQIFAVDPRFVAHAHFAYSTIEVLGEGGMGAVYRVKDEKLDRELALKVIRDSVEDDDQKNILARFWREATITARLNHPSIPTIHEAGIDRDGRVFMLMEVVEGKELKELIEEANLSSTEGKISRKQRELLDILIRVGETMAYAHSRGILHRDLKPANIMVGQFGEVMVMDWGLAKDTNSENEDLDKSLPAFDLSAEDRSQLQSHGLTQVGAVLGTPGYMSPEQCDGERTDARSDVYALGNILCEILTGHTPIEAEGMYQFLFKILNNEIRSPKDLRASVPKELNAICMKAIEFEGKDRYQTCADFAKDVKAYLAGDEVSVYQYGRFESFSRLISRNPVAVTIVFSTLLTVFLSLSAFLVYRQETIQSQNLALKRQEEANKAEQRANDAKQKALQATLFAERKKEEADAAKKAVLTEKSKVEDITAKSKRNELLQLEELIETQLLANRVTEAILLARSALSKPNFQKSKLIQFQLRKALYSHHLINIIPGGASIPIETAESKQLIVHTEAGWGEFDVAARQFKLLRSISSKAVLSLSHSEKKLLSVDRERGVIKVHDRLSRRVQRQVRLGVDKNGKAPYARAFLTNDDKKLLILSSALSIVDLSAGSIRNVVLPKMHWHRVVISPNSQWMAIGTSMDRFFLVNLRTEEIHVIDTLAMQLFFSKDSKSLVGYGRKLPSQHTIFRCDLNTLKPRHFDVKFGAAAFDVSKDGDLFLLRETNSLVVRDSKTGKIVKTLLCNFSEIVTAIISPDARWVYAASTAGEIERWEISTGANEKVVILGERVNQLRVISNGTQLLCASAKNSWIISLDPLRKTLVLPDLFNKTSSYPNVIFSKDGQRVLFHRSPGPPLIWNRRKGEMRIFGGTQYVSWTQMSPNGRWILIVDRNQQLNVRDFKSGKLYARLKNKFVNSRAITFHPTEPKLALFSKEKGVIVWNFKWAETKNYKVDVEGFSELKFSRSGKFLAGAAYDQSVRVWRLSTGTCRTLGPFKTGVSKLLFSQSDKFLFFVAAKQLYYQGLDELVMLQSQPLGGNVSDLAIHGNSSSLLAWSNGGSSSRKRTWSAIDSSIPEVKSIFLSNAMIAPDKSFRHLFELSSSGKLLLWDAQLERQFVLQARNRSGASYSSKFLRLDNDFKSAVVSTGHRSVTIFKHFVSVADLIEHVDKTVNVALKQTKNGALELSSPETK